MPLLITARFSASNDFSRIKEVEAVIICVPTPLNKNREPDITFIIETGKAIAPRKAYGAALVALGTADKRIVGLDADVKNSTYAEWFYKKFPDRFLEAKIAEQNMASVAAGCAAAGKIPFVSTFAKFLERA